MQDRQQDNGGSLWTFCTALYQSPGMESLCLDFQDRLGADVNLLLWCIWLDQNHKFVSDKRWSRAQSAAKCWQAVVVSPLRILRRGLKSCPRLSAFRSVVKFLELRSEYGQLRILQQMASKDGDGSPGRRGFVYRYLNGLGVPRSEGRRLMQSLLSVGGLVSAAHRQLAADYGG